MLATIPTNEAILAAVLETHSEVNEVRKEVAGVNERLEAVLETLASRDAPVGGRQLTD